MLIKISKILILRYCHLLKHIQWLHRFISYFLLILLSHDPHARRRFYSRVNGRAPLQQFWQHCCRMLAHRRGRLDHLNSLCLFIYLFFIFLLLLCLMRECDLQFKVDKDVDLASLNCWFRIYLLTTHDLVQYLWNFCRIQ